MNLVADWKKAWRWFSVQAMALSGAIQVTWVSLPLDLKGSIPHDLVTGAAISLAVLGIIGRVVDQKDA